MKSKPRPSGQPALAAAAFLLVACSDGPAAPAPAIRVTIATPTSTDLIVGDEMVLTASTTGSAPTIVWRAGDPDIAQVAFGRVEGLRPGTVWIFARAGGAADSVSITVSPRPGGYSANQVDYFLEIAFGFEFGSASLVTRRWAEDVRVRVNGTPTAADLATLDDIVADVSALTETADMVLVDESPSVELHVIPVDRFADTLADYVPGNVGFFTVWWDATQHFVRAVVLIGSDLEQPLRNHLLREELTQILGLGQDSFRHPESIFFQNFSLTDSYAPVDEAVIEMLYRSQLSAGMSQADAGRVVRRLTRLGAAASALEVPSPTAQASPTVDGRPGKASGSQEGRR